MSYILVASLICLHLGGLQYCELPGKAIPTPTQKEWKSSKSTFWNYVLQNVTQTNENLFDGTAYTLPLGEYNGWGTQLIIGDGTTLFNQYSFWSQNETPTQIESAICGGLMFSRKF